MNSQQLKKLTIADKPGVYFFKKGNTILYIGKATSLRERTRSYFAPDIMKVRSQAIADMVALATTLEYQETDSALEALILEAELIKKYQPKYNTKEKDDKSFNYVVITKDVMPQVLLVRGRNIKVAQELEGIKPAYVFGPFTSGGSIKEGLRIIRRIFPFIDGSSIKKDQYVFYRQLGLTPDVSDVLMQKKYQESIKHIVAFFKGKKKDLIVHLEKDMMAQAKKLNFEEANLIKKQIFALTHINDIAVIKNDFENNHESSIGAFRIEGYDVAHLSGKNMVGVMTVVTNGTVDKSEYKKFIIRTQKDANDTGALYEVLMRRFRHIEWGLPDLVVLDGGEAQLNVARQVLDFYQLHIPCVSVLKDERHKPKDILSMTPELSAHRPSILLVNNEAHRFSITFHKDKRAKAFLKK